MISKNMEVLVQNSSEIRKMFEEGKKMAAEIGKENVFDFSLGNPSVEPPAKVKESIKKILDEVDPNYVHGYMANAGYPEVRQKIAESENRKYGTDYDADDIIMIVGAAGGMNILLRTFLELGDEVIVFAPFFGEYRNYIANYGGKCVVVPADKETFHLNLEAFKGLINEKTKAVIVNNPNNPSGVVYPKEELQALQAILEDAEKRIGHPIYVISDEPYRTLLYDGVELPYMTKYVKNAIISYSYSKSLSLPGERIGFVAIPKHIDDYENVKSAAVVANRILGFVNAPSLMQLAVAECVDESTDINIYDTNRKLLYGGLTDLGFTCIKPEGAFYVLLKSPVENEYEFLDAAKKLGILMVSTRSFGCEGYIRLAYCVSKETIVNSMAKFAILADQFLK